MHYVFIKLVLIVAVKLFSIDKNLYIRNPILKTKNL